MEEAVFDYKDDDNRDIEFLEKSKEILINKQKDPKTRRALNETAVKYICCALTALDARKRV